MKGPNGGPPRLRVARSPALFVGRRQEIERCVSTADHLRLTLVYGVAGIGKTSFVLRVGEELCDRHGGRLAYHACRPGEGVAAIARDVLEQLAPATGGTPARHRSEPVEALIRAAHLEPTFVCLDDVHRTDDPALLEAAVRLASRRLPLWLIMASREALQVSPGSIDHLVLRLGPLSRDDTRALWFELERLYGPAPLPFDKVTARDAVTPLFLKQVFAEPMALASADTMGLSELSDLEAELLAEICAHRRPAPLAALRAGRDEAAVGRVVRLLTRRFLVELGDDESLAVHDLVRDAVNASPRSPTPHEHARCLARYRALAAAGCPEEAVEQETLYHAVACAADDIALEVLERRATSLERFLPLGSLLERDLAQAIDTLGTRRALPAPLQLLRARIDIRQGHAVQTLPALVALAAVHGDLAEPDLAEASFAAARIKEAVLHAERAVRSSRLDLPGRLWGLVLLVQSHHALGDLDAARRALADGAPLLEEAGAVGQAARLAIEAVLAFDAEDYSTATEALAALQRSNLRDFVLAAVPLVAALEGAVAAAAGRPPTERVDASGLLDETMFYRLAARTLRAAELVCRGDARAAAAMAEATMHAAAEVGNRTVEWWSACLWSEAARLIGPLGAVAPRLEASARLAEETGHRRAWSRLQAGLARALLGTGHVDRARAVALSTLPQIRHAPGTEARLRAVVALADASEGRCGGGIARLGRANHTQGIDREDWRLAKCELLLWEGRLECARQAARDTIAAAEAAGWSLLACRGRMLLAEAAYRLGDFVASATALATARAVAEREGYAAEVLFGGLVHAGLARCHGRFGEARESLTKVVGRGAELGFDTESAAAAAALAVLGGRPVLPASPGTRLARRLTLAEPVACRLREGASVWWLAPSQVTQLDLRKFAVLVDLVGGRIRVGGRVADLSRRAALLGVVRALATQPGEPVTTPVLVQRAWGHEYHPLRHHSRVTMAVSRLRSLLGRKAISGDDTGYRLSVPGSWAVIEPVTEDDGVR